MDFARSLTPRSELFAFIMPANLPGAGLHELAATLLAGRTVIVKTAALEPVFFAEFARVLTALDPEVGARLAVFNWGREHADLNAALRTHCDHVIAFGDDGTLAQLALTLRSGSNADSSAGPLTGFGARVSGIVVAAGATRGENPLAEVIAREVSAFEQRGCLSPHHLLVADADGGAAPALARRIAAVSERITRELVPPRALALEDAIAIRNARERARWRALGGAPVELYEGNGWTVVYDRDAAFTSGPGFRTLFVSPFFDCPDLARRLAPVAGRLEAVGFATSPLDAAESIAELRQVLAHTSASWICAPGQMQSPPPAWPHDNGQFIRLLRA
jgi:hypothetical protein